MLLGDDQGAVLGAPAEAGAFADGESAVSGDRECWQRKALIVCCQWVALSVEWVEWTESVG